MSSPVGTGARVVVRPHKIRRVVIPSAVVVFAACTVAGLLLRNSDTGVVFRVSDQFALIGIGAILAGCILLALRPRLRADDDGMEVRNSVSTHRFAWSEVLGVSFPDGASCARVELPADEYKPIVAIQAIDGERAVRAMRELRELRRRIGHLERETSGSTKRDTG